MTPGDAEYPNIPRTQIGIVASQTDKIHQLIKRNEDFKSATNIVRTVSVSQAAVFVNNARDRVFSGMKSIPDRHPRYDTSISKGFKRRRQKVCLLSYNRRPRLGGGF